jgi:hypothetical protein
MSTLTNILAGLGGAIALNILHESLKRIDGDMPRIDKLGEEALQKGLSKAGTAIDDGSNLYRATLGADLLSNSLYYSLIGSGNSKNIWPKALFMGISAGIGAVTVPDHIGLDDAPVTRTSKTKALTVGYYLFGALVTGCILKMINKQN